MLFRRFQACFAWVFFGLALSCAALAQTQIGDDLIGESEGDLFGSSVALSADGNRMVVGSISNSDASMGSGQVQVFENVSGDWVQLGQDINGTGVNSTLGRDVAISSDGTIIAVGADGFDDGDNTTTGTGKVCVFELSNGSWVQLGQELLGSENGNLLFGNEVCLSSDGSILAVGAPAGATGSASVYQNQGGTWVQLGDDINGNASELFGNGLALSAEGTRLAIGGDGFTGGGVLRVFDFDSLADNWTQVGQTVVGMGNDRIGGNVDISDDGSIVAVSAGGNEDVAVGSGAVRVYRDTGGTWAQIGDDLDGTLLKRFGSSLSLSSDGSIIAVGAFGDGMPAIGFGVPPEGPCERIFRNENDSWVELALISGEPGSFFGLQSHISSDSLTLAVGAQSFDGDGFNRGLVRVFDLSDLFDIVHGDVNQDGLVNFFDIQPFIGVLADGEFQAEADCDGNGAVDFFDIAPFIAVLAAGQ